VSVLVASCAAVTCLGDEDATFAALLWGASGVGDLRGVTPDVNVRRAYHLDNAGPGRLCASRWLTGVVATALARAKVDLRDRRVAALVGTGLRELRTVESWVADGADLRAEQLHLAEAVRRAAPELTGTLTISNACSAAGHALALGQDLIELGDADVVVVAGTDTMTESMLAMIGRFDADPTERIRPFDADRSGVLLGDGAAAVVLVPERADPPEPVARLLGTGLSCDAYHETAPDRSGIARAVGDALERTGRTPQDVDVIFAHGTGTAQNDPAEADVIRSVFDRAEPGPLITAIKGAVGHTSGASALTSLAMAVHSLRRGVVPPVVGLRTPLAEADGLRLVVGAPRPAPLTVAQVNAFGFGGVNAVTLVERI
jgi:3-oxoacyl-[acyl-carrier-protein] synthase II